MFVYIAYNNDGLFFRIFVNCSVSGVSSIMILRTLFRPGRRSKGEYGLHRKFSVSFFSNARIPDTVGILRRRMC